MENLLVLLRASRPVGWAVPVLIFLLGHGLQGFSAVSIVQMILLAFPFCLLLFGINDIYDYESDRINPRKKLLEGIKLEKRHYSLVRKAALLSAALLLLSSLATLNITNILAMSALLLVSYSYSAPPIRLKEKPPLDSLANGAGFFFAYLLGFSFSSTITHVALNMYFVALCVAGIHAFSSVMDFEYDKHSKNRTFAVAYGKRAAALFALAVFALTLLFAGIKTPLWRYYIAACALLFLAGAVFPKPRLASLLTKAIYIGFVLVALYFLITQKTV